jgi:hypothetical protein
MSIQTWIPTYDEFKYTGMGHGEDDGYGRCWILKADHVAELAAKEREIERLKAQVERLQTRESVRKLALEIACSGESGTTAGCMIEATHRLTLIASRAAEKGPRNER